MMELLEKVVNGLECHGHKGACGEDCPYHAPGERCSEPLCADALALINAQQERIVALEAAQKWISVKDRYPDAAGVAVLVSATSQYGQQHVFEAFIGYGDFTWYTMDCTKMGNRRITCNEVSNNWKITHWMPLPEPPKEDGQ